MFRLRFQEHRKQALDFHRNKGLLTTVENGDSGRLNLVALDC